MDRTHPRRRIRNTFADPTQRSVLLFAVVLVNLVLTFLNLFHVFDHSPSWVGVIVWVVDVLMALVLVGVLTYAVRDLRQRRRTR